MASHHAAFLWALWSSAGGGLCGSALDSTRTDARALAPHPGEDRAPSILVEARERITQPLAFALVAGTALGIAANVSCRQLSSGSRCRSEVGASAPPPTPELLAALVVQALSRDLQLLDCDSE